jgi:hypothetical protein
LLDFNEREAKVDSAVWGLIGTLVGAATSVGTTWLASRSSYYLQSTAKELERIERANAFQRQNLLDIQEALHDALRLTTQAHMEDLRAHKDGAVWGRTMLGEPVNEGFRHAARRVAILTDRISDDILRAKVKALMSLASDVLFSRSEIDSTSRLQQCYAAGSETLESVGTALRSYY